MKQTMTNFLESLFYSKNSQIKNQAKNTYTILKVLQEINQALERFSDKQPRFSDLEIGFNNYKSAQDLATNLSLIELGKLNSLLKISNQDNLLQNFINKQNQTDKQLHNISIKMDSFFHCNSIDQKKILNQGIENIDL